ncbi:carbohydrate ABC transporter substrate-binding protein, partial [Mesorhizobium sp. M7A.F.Ca.CA.001.12.2.1]
MKFTRRDVIRTTAGAAAGALGSRFISSPALAQDGPKYKPEDGAKLRLLRWS